MKKFFAMLIAAIMALGMFGAYAESKVYEEDIAAFVANVNSLCAANDLDVSFTVDKGFRNFKDDPDGGYQIFYTADEENSCTFWVEGGCLLRVDFIAEAEAFTDIVWCALFALDTFESPDQQLIDWCLENAEKVLEEYPDGEAEFVYDWNYGIKVSLKLSHSSGYTAAPLLSAAVDFSALYEGNAGFDGNVNAFVNHINTGLSANGVSDSYSQRNTDAEAYYAERFPDDECVVYANESGSMMCEFWGDAAGNLVRICASTNSSANIETLAYTAIFIAEGVGTVDQDYVDWCFETASDLSRADNTAEYQINGVTITFTAESGIYSVTMQ